jgi:hypothetical protein
MQEQEQQEEVAFGEEGEGRQQQQQQQKGQHAASIGPSVLLAVLKSLCYQFKTGRLHWSRG